jgi:predicted XRE-type DNA-binding protein
LNIDAGILEGKPKRTNLHDLVVVAITPGIPLRWVIVAANLNTVQKGYLKYAVRNATEAQKALAVENAASVTEEDAWLMLKATPPTYREAVPLYAQMWLKASPMIDREVATLLGVTRHKVMRWRNQTDFDFLTGVSIK